MENVRNRRRSARLAQGRRKGVLPAAGGKFRAQITVNKQMIILGTFDTEDEGARVYDAAAREYFGEFAACNFEEPSNGHR
jgi:hypothetical protein